MVDWLETHAKLQTYFESFPTFALMIDIQHDCLHGKHVLSVAKISVENERSWRCSTIFCDFQGFDVLGASCSGHPWVVGAFVGTTGEGTQGISHAQPGCFGPGTFGLKEFSQISFGGEGFLLQVG